MKRKRTTLLAVILTLTIPISSFAGTWKYEEPHWMNIETSGRKNTGWYSEGKNDWYYLNDDGIMQTGWLGEYHLHEISDGTKGHMDYGWYYDGNTWYFLNTVHDGTFGARKTGWQWIDGYCYCFAEDGKMYADTVTPDGYQVNEEGRWIVDNQIQFVPGKGLSSKIIDPHINGGSGKSGGKVINGGGTSGGSSAGSLSKPTKPDVEKPSDEGIQEKPNDEREKALSLVENKNLQEILVAAENASSEEKKMNLVLKADSIFAKAEQDGIISRYIWNTEKTTAACEYPNGIVDLFGFWEIEYDEELSLKNDERKLMAAIPSDAVPLVIMENDVELYQTEVPLNSSFARSTQAEIIKNNKAIVYSAFPENGTHNDEVYTKGFKNVQEKLNTFQEESFNCNIIYRATVDDYKTMDQYGMIFINAHGKIDTRGLLYNDKELSIICLDENITSQKDSKYLSDMKSRRVMRYFSGTKSTYAITPDFIRHYYDGEDKLENSIIFNGSCLGYYNDNLADAFLDSGAAAFVGFTESVRTLYVNAIFEEIVDGLLKGETLDEAVSLATEKLCDNDNDYVEMILGCQVTDGKTSAEIKFGGNGNIVIQKKADHETEENYTNIQLFIELFDKWFEKNNYVVESKHKEEMFGGNYYVNWSVHKKDEKFTFQSDVMFSFDNNGDNIVIDIDLQEEGSNLGLLEEVCKFLNISFTYDEYANSNITDCGEFYTTSMVKNGFQITSFWNPNEKDNFIIIQEIGH